MAGHHDMAWNRSAERIIAESEVIAAGFPCQDISLAGEGAGLAGSRSGLVWSLLRTIRLVRPHYAVLENVAALLGRGLDQILGRMAQVGYDAEWHCIPASAVGAPHQRDRIWIIATDAGSEQHEGYRAPISGALAQELSGTVADAATMFGVAIVGDESDGNLAGRQKMADADSAGLQNAGAISDGANGIEGWRMPSASGWWSAEPALDRVANGVPNRVDRLASLGNAVVPKIPEIIGRSIMQLEK